MSARAHQHAAGARTTTGSGEVGVIGVGALNLQEPGTVRFLLGEPLPEC
ncbi:hypothetical protein AB0F25_09195 [Streptomyces wedmorensis]